MAKQIEGQISFDFMETSNKREISMENFMNRPEKLDAIEKGPVKEKMPQNKKSKISTKKDTKPSQNKSAEVTHSEKIDLKSAANRKETHSQTKKNTFPTPQLASNCIEYYQQAVMYVSKHKGITVGTIMRICRISANDASFVFQELLKNRIIDKTGRVYKEKKEL